MLARTFAISVFISTALIACAKPQQTGAASDRTSVVPQQHTAVTTTPAAVAWTRHVGGHGRPVRWGKSIRGVGRREDTSVPVASDSLSEAELTTRLRELAPRHDLVMPIGGLEGAREQDSVAAFLDGIERDGGRAWREELRQRAAAIRPVLGEAGGSINLQVGNEINSYHYATAIHARRGGRGRVDANSETIIPVYVEYFLAPAVEALRNFDWGASPAASRIRLVLGSVANSANAKSRAWLYDLLDYRVRGDFAPTLEGKRVVELIDIIAIHYLVTGADANWMQVLDSLQTRWVDSGLAQGVWSTEELGRRRADDGLGAVTAVKVTARYLHWWSRRGYGPDRSRFLLWGSSRGRRGTRGDDAMETLYDFLGEAELVDVTGSLDLAPTGDLEAYAFDTTADPSKRAIFILPRPLSQESAVERIAFRTRGSPEWASATAHVFTAAGHSRAPVALNLVGDSYHLSLPDDFRIEPKSAVAFFLERAPAQ